MRNRIAEGEEAGKKLALIDEVEALWIRRVNSGLVHQRTCPFCLGCDSHCDECLVTTLFNMRAGSNCMRLRYRYFILGFRKGNPIDYWQEAKGKRMRRYWARKVLEKVRLMKRLQFEELRRMLRE